MSPRGKPRLRLTDTTLRDAQQSLIGGRMSTAEAVAVAEKLDKVGFAALEAFGGATFEVQLGDLGENPWEFLRALKKAAPKTPIQALIRGQNLVGQRNFADDTVQLFIAHAAACGVDIFRFFDPLNDLRNMEAAIKAAKKARKQVQGALSYAVSPAHDLRLWISLAKGLQKLGVDAVVIKDTSGLLSPQTAWELVGALTHEVKLPVSVHSHCSSGMAPMAYMAGLEAGATGLDTALSPLAWGASQPAAESVVAALAGGDYDTGLSLEPLMEACQVAEAVKAAHADHLSPLADRVDADILRYRVPGTMLQEVDAQLREHNAGDRLDAALEEIGRVRAELGHPPLVTPIRNLIGAQAVLNVIGGERYLTVTKELKDYLQGLFGRPPQPASAEVRRLVLGREEPITIRPADLLKPELPAARADLKRLGVEASDDNLLIQLLFPSLAGPFFKSQAEGRQGSGRSRASRAKEAEEAEAAAATPPEPDGEGQGAASAPAAEPASPPPAQAAEFQVEVDGETFTVRVVGAGMTVTSAPAGGSAPAAAPPPAATGAGAVTAPMQGLIVKLPVKVGDQVKAGDTVAVLEAMKMQNDIAAPKNGKVSAVHVKEGDVVKPGQPILALE